MMSLMPIALASMSPNPTIHLKTQSQFSVLRRRRVLEGAGMYLSNIECKFQVSNVGQ